MCNLAGYAGNRRAAPILLEMLRKEEGFDGGYFTGIATVHEGKLHWRKVIGDVNQLIRQTDAMDLPGTIGIIQGRSRCGDYGGDENWAHPFINPKGNMAYAANGIMSRLFKGVTDMSVSARAILCPRTALSRCQGTTSRSIPLKSPSPRSMTSCRRRKSLRRW